MFCTNCGAEINDKAVVCPKCGVPVSEKAVATSAHADVPNHMVGAILTTLFCCLVGGIVSIVYASKVNTKLAQGDIEGAKAASRTAKRWIIANILFALIIPLIGILLGALFPAVSSAKTSADSSVASMRGRNLFVAITEANDEREAHGYPSVWPHTADSSDLQDSTTDISGIAFRNSAEYFKTLFDMASYGSDDWAPYVAVEPETVLKLSKDSRFCDWIVAANVQDEFDDVIPVLISANVDPSVLKTSFDGYDNTPIPFGSAVGRTQLPWCDKFVIVVRKGGSAEVFKRQNFTYSNLYHKQSFSAPGLKYLDVK